VWGFVKARVDDIAGRNCGVEKVKKLKKSTRGGVGRRVKTAPTWVVQRSLPGSPRGGGKRGVGEKENVANGPPAKARFLVMLLEERT